MAAQDLERKKLRVGIFFGGKSAEHEVSLLSAKNVFAALDKTKFEPVLIGIDTTGVWRVLPSSFLNQSNERLEPGEDATKGVSLAPGLGTLLMTGPAEMIEHIDVAFPILHGPLGEDGSIQGLFELANVPYVGPGVLGSAVGMDKDVMKRLLRDAGIPVTPFRSFGVADKVSITPSTIFEELGTPVFVKPANMGSSVGVARASDAASLQQAVDSAFDYDAKIIIEQAAVGGEIECAVLGNDQPRASTIGRIIPRADDFYSYEAKYLDENGAILEIPAQLPLGVAERAQELAIKTFQVLGCEGMGRVDMFVTDDGDLLVNEINTIPGFTKVSMYPKLWEVSGLSYTALITELIRLALERHDRHSTRKSTH